MTWRRIAGEAAFVQVWPVLSLAIGGPDDARSAHIQSLYLAHPGYELWCLGPGEAVVGVIGLRVDLSTPHEGEITHVSVAASVQRQGLGRTIIAELKSLKPLTRRWFVETDDDAVGFYRSLGFEVQDLGELYPGVRRYRCTLDIGVGG